MNAEDAIHIEQMEISASVGVPEEERARAQRLTASLTLWPMQDFSALGDEISRVVDYAAVAEEVRQFVAPRRDRLIETLAGAIAQRLLAAFPIRAVRIELRKFILPQTEYVAVILKRSRGAG